MHAVSTNQFADILHYNDKSEAVTYGLFIWRWAGPVKLAGPGEMIFMPRSHGIFYLSSIKKFVMSLEKDCLIKYFLQ